MKRLSLLFPLLAAAACVEPSLVPTNPSQKIDDTLALAEAGGVKVYVNGDAWRGDPVDLPQVLTPVRLDIENVSGKPLRLAYRDFTLVGASGMRYPAIPPLQTQGTMPNSALDPSTEKPQLVLSAWHRAAPVRGPGYVRPPPRFRHHHFYIAPHYGYFYPGYTVWSSPFPYAGYSYTYNGWPETLPSDDMLAEALPEGVLESNGKVDGFVYFQSVADREQRVHFEVQLVDASNNQSFGKVSVPMLVRPH